MPDNGFGIPANQNGFSPNTIQIEFAKLNADSEVQKQKFQFRKELTNGLFSGNFLAFCLTCIIVICGIIAMFKLTTFQNVLDFWKVIIPLVSTYMGYAIGKNTKK